jgi:hypothetical protein
MLLIDWHIAAMVAVTIIMIGERLEAPRHLSWRVRGLGKLIRIAVNRAWNSWSKLRQTRITQSMRDA